MSDQTIDLPATVPHNGNTAVAGECMMWPMGKTGAGYGVAYLCGVAIHAHRLVYWMTFGPIPRNLFVCHRCDNPGCINPSHLFLGTPKDNTMDAWKKGRLPAIPPMPGEMNPKAILSAEQVIEIRRRYAIGGVLQKELAEEFGVKPITISNITSRKTWKHL